MSIYFSKIIKAGERQREFNFRQLANGADIRFSVDVPDEKGNRIYFHMFPDSEGKWKTSTEILPVWIQNSEDILSTLIQDELKSFK